MSKVVMTLNTQLVPFDKEPADVWMSEPPIHPNISFALYGRANNGHGYEYVVSNGVVVALKQNDSIPANPPDNVIHIVGEKEYYFVKAEENEIVSLEGMEFDALINSAPATLYVRMFGKGSIARRIMV